MEIKICDDYRLTSDPHNIILEQRKVNKKNGQEYWIVDSFHRTVEQALDALLQKRIRESEATTIKELRAEIREVRKQITACLE